MGVIGGGIVGVSIALAAARRGVPVTLLERERELGLAASGTNSGILHTGFDSPPGTLETRMILRSAELRDEILESLRVPIVRTGAVLEPRDEAERQAVEQLAHNAATNGVPRRYSDAVTPHKLGRVLERNRFEKATRRDGYGKVAKGRKGVRIRDTSVTGPVTGPPETRW